MVGRLEAKVDVSDFDYLSQWKWKLHKNGYAYRNSRHGNIYMHRLILNPPNGLETDHINLDRLDNRRENLRAVTHAENLKTRRVRNQWTGPWPTPNSADSQRGPESRATKAKRGAGGINQPHAVIEATWQTPTAADGGSTSRGGSRIDEMLLGGQVRAANWQTCVVMDKEQSGSSARGPSQTSQVRGSEWATPNSRDHKDTGTTHGNRKSPNPGTQANLADGPTSSG